MIPEDAKIIKCDHCGVVIGLYQHSTGWRCSRCIWNERENLIKWTENLLSSGDYTHLDNQTKQVVVVSRRNMNALAEVIKEVTAVNM